MLKWNQSYGSAPLPVNATLVVLPLVCLQKGDTRPQGIKK